MSVNKYPSTGSKYLCATDIPIFARQIQTWHRVEKRVLGSKQVKPSSFTEDQPPGWGKKASKSNLGTPQLIFS